MEGGDVMEKALLSEMLEIAAQSPDQYGPFPTPRESRLRVYRDHRMFGRDVFAEVCPDEYAVVKVEGGAALLFHTRQVRRAGGLHRVFIAFE